MNIERGNFSPENEAMNKVQVGTGDPINVSKLEKITIQERRTISEPAPVKRDKLPIEHLQNAEEALSKLPFRFGDKEHIGTIPRTVHEASITIGPRPLAYDAPESEKSKQALFIKLQAGQQPLSFEKAKNLTFEQQETRNGIVNLIHFDTDEAFKVGDDEIGEVRLIIPVEPNKL